MSPQDDQNTSRPAHYAQGFQWMPPQVPAQMAGQHQFLPQPQVAATQASAQAPAQVSAQIAAHHQVYPGGIPGGPGQLTLVPQPMGISAHQMMPQMVIPGGPDGPGMAQQAPVTMVPGQQALPVVQADLTPQPVLSIDPLPMGNDLDDDLVITDNQFVPLQGQIPYKSIPVAAVKTPVQKPKDKRANEAADVIAAIRKKPKVSPEPDLQDPLFERAVARLTDSFKTETDSDFYYKLISDTCQNYQNNFLQLSERLCKIFLSIPESLYHTTQDYRYKGWLLAIDCVKNIGFWSTSNASIKRFFLRVRNWLTNDMKSKDFEGIAKSLQLLVKIKISKENLESFKIWDLLPKLKRLDKYPKIKTLVTELLNTPKSPVTQNANVTPSTSVMKSISAAAAKKPDQKLPISRSSIFINDPNKVQKRDTLPKGEIGDDKPQGSENPQKPSNKKVWALGEYLSKSSLKLLQQQLQQQQLSPQDIAKDDNAEDEVYRTEDGLFSILRRKTANDETRKRRKAAAKGVRFKDRELVTVEIIADSYDRSLNVSLEENGFGITEDESVPWSEPAQFNVQELDWYDSELFEGNPTYRGGSHDEFHSTDNAEQVARNQNLQPLHYTRLRDVPRSPYESDSLKVLPPRIVELKMVPFGNAGI